MTMLYEQVLTVSECVERFSAESARRVHTDMIERAIRPPAVISPNTTVLSPPLGSTEEYMKYLRDHAADYHRFFHGDDA